LIFENLTTVELMSHVLRLIQNVTNFKLPDIYETVEIIKNVNVL
jgi:hypothetical protein